MHINCYMQGVAVFRHIYEANKWKNELGVSLS